MRQGSIVYKKSYDRTVTKTGQAIAEGENKMEGISIGTMAKLNNVTIQTLRYYDKIGLLKPAFTGKNSNYRYYDIKQSAKLDMIQYMKDLGMPLEKIKEQFEKEDIGVIQDMLAEQSIWVDKKIKELQQMKKAVEVCRQNYIRYSNAPKDGRISIQHIRRRKIFCYDGKKNIYEHNLATYEYILRELKQQVLIQHLPSVYFCNVGSILRKKMIDEHKFVSTEIFLFVDDDFEIDEGIEVIPENNYICIYCDSFWSEKKYARILFDYINKKHYEIIGDYICEVVTELPVFPRDERNMFIKLQIPVKNY